MCILAPCARALQNLLNICFDYADKHNIVYNSHKSVCMYIKSLESEPTDDGYQVSQRTHTQSSDGIMI